jgi:D-alanyl-D-alanine carboxypeptidase/D-alanyl-D-alanine-endopeptidase (penicillin-binding protein 4)
MILYNALLSTLLFFSLEDPAFEQASVSAYAVDMRSGEIVLDQNSHKSLAPASCMKLVTTAAALHILGPDFRFQTDLEYDGNIDEHGVLYGNLYIHGKGDPCLGSERIAPSLNWREQAEAWAEAIAKLGIRTIQGNVIGDATEWEQALAVPSWNWEDLGNYYGAGACALSFHENAYTLTFKPGNQRGAKTSLVGTEPPLWGVTLQNEVTTGAVGSGDQACIYGAEFTPLQTVRGTIPAGVETFSIRGAIPNPPEFCARALVEALQSRGISVKENSYRVTSKRVIFHSTFSPALKEIVFETNHTSHNLYAEHLLKKIGERVLKEGSTQAGCAAVAAFLKEKQIDLTGFYMADGSGLSRKNMITAKQFVSLLTMMKRSDRFAEYLHSLPELGSNTRAKDGSMAFIKAYAGYAGDIAFAVIVNQCQDPAMRTKLVQRIAQLVQPSAEEYPGTPSNR